MEIAANALIAPLTNRTAIEPSPEVSLALPVKAPEELAAARFSAIMRGPELSQAAPAQLSASGAATLRASEVPQTRGDQILASLQAASGDFQNNWKSMQAKLQSDQTMDIRDMMGVQLQVTHMAVQYDLLGKVVSRSSQNIDQLVRVQ